MPKYIALINWTQQGIENVKDGPGRTAAAIEAAKAAGIDMEAYYTMGRYDLVAIVDAPDDETMSRVTLSIGAEGNIRTETMRAFTVEEMQGIVESLL